MAYAYFATWLIHLYPAVKTAHKEKQLRNGQEYPKCECCPYGKTAEILAADILLKGNASKLQALNGFKTSWLGIIQSVIIKGLKAFLTPLWVEVNNGKTNIC